MRVFLLATALLVAFNRVQATESLMTQGPFRPLLVTSDPPPLPPRSTHVKNILAEGSSGTNRMNKVAEKFRHWESSLFGDHDGSDSSGSRLRFRASLASLKPVYRSSELTGDAAIYTQKVLFGSASDNMDDQIGEPQFNMVEDRTPPPPTRPLPAPPLTSKKSTLPSSDSEKPELTPRQYQPISSLPPHQTAGSDGILASRQSDKETWKLTRNGEQKHVAVPAKSGPGTSGSYPIPLFERLSHSNQPEPPHTPASPRVLRGTNPSIDLPNHMDVVNQVGPVDANAGRDSDRAINAGLGDLQVHLNEARTLTAMELVLELATLRQLLTQDTPQDRTYRAREWALRWTLQNSLRVLDPMVTISEPDQKNVDGPGIHSSQV